MAAPTAQELLTLRDDPTFELRVTVSFSHQLWLLLTTPPPQNTPPDTIKAQLNALATVIALGPAAQALQLKKLMPILIGADLVRTNGAAISDVDLDTVTAAVVAVFVQFIAAGGAL